MSKDINDIDKIIKEALTQEEAKFYDELEEQNLLQMVGGLYKGKLGWLAWLTNIVMILMFAVFIYCVVQLFNTEITNMLIKWGLGAVFSLLSVSLLKIFAWMQMDKNAIIRELKRLELQISVLSSKLSK